MSFHSSLQLNKKVILFIQKCYRIRFNEKKKKIDDVLRVADNAKDEVYEIAQLLINDDIVLFVGFLNDGTYSQ